MLGFGEHTPFECIGQIEESRLALYLCYQKGVRGEAMKWYEYIKSDNIEQILQKFTRIYAENGLPQKYASTLYAYFEEIQDDTFEYFRNVIT